MIVPAPFTDKMTTNEVGKKHLASAGLAAAARAASVYRHRQAAGSGTGGSGGHSPKRTQATTSLATKSYPNKIGGTIKNESQKVRNVTLSN